FVGLHFLEGFPDFPFGDVERLYLVHGLLLLPVGVSWPVVSAEQRSPFGPAPLQSLPSLIRAAPSLCSASVLSSSRFWPLETSPFASERQVLTFRTRAWLSFAPSTCRMPLGQTSGFPRADPGGRVSPRFRHRLIRFRHFIDGSLALASLNLACRNPVPAFPQRSPPLLLTTAACGGLRSTPDCRLRRALLHLSYRCASPFGPAILVTHDPQEEPKGHRCDYRPPAQAEQPSFGGGAARHRKPLRDFKLR